MPVCPKCRSANFKQNEDPLYFHCSDCGRDFLLSEVKVLKRWKRGTK